MDTARLLWLLCAAISSVVAQGPLYFPVGADLMLELESPPDKIDRVVWKHGVNLLADLTNNKFNSYGPFKGFASLDARGGLSIKNIQLAHAGVYSVEVNNQVQAQQYDVQVMVKLARPEIRATPVACSYTSESCVLVCVVNTTGAGHVTYSWFFDQELSEDTSSNLTIVPSSDPPPTYTCRVKNPVSEQRSEPLENPLIPPPPSPPYWVAAVVLGLVVVVGAVIGYWKKDVIIKKFSKGGAEDPPNNPDNRPPATTPSPNEMEPLKSKETTPEETAPPSGAENNTDQP